MKRKSTQQDQQEQQMRLPAGANQQQKGAQDVQQEASAVFVPISLVTSASVVAAGAEPNINEQQRVLAVTWALVELKSNKQQQEQASVKWKKTVQCGADNDKLAATRLADALEQLVGSLGQQQMQQASLVALDSLAVRQQLQPIARRLKVELAPIFGQYIDLVKEFERTRWGAQRRTALHHHASRAAAAVHADEPLNNETETTTTTTTSPAQQRRIAEMLKVLGNTDEHEQLRRCAKCELASATQSDANNQVPPTNTTTSTTAPKAQQPQCDDDATSQTDSQESPNRWRRRAGAESATSGHCFGCSLLHNEQAVDSMSAIVCRLLNEGHQFGKLERVKCRVEVGLCDVPANEAEQWLVRARGLPWQATEQDIVDFFIGLNIAKGGVNLCLSRQGRRNGEALVQFENREHRNLALARHKHFMGQRYIEVYRASADDFQQVATACTNNKAEAFLSRGAQVIVRARGLPFSCTPKQVVEFFASNIATSEQETPNVGARTRTSGAQKGAGKVRVLGACNVLAGEQGVLLVRNQDDKPTGDAFVLFATEEDGQRALAKHHENVGSRYVELFRSSVSEVQQVLSISVSTESQASIKCGGRISPCVSAGEPRLASPAAARQARQQHQARADSPAATYAQVLRAPDADADAEKQEQADEPEQKAPTNSPASSLSSGQEGTDSSPSCQAQSAECSSAIAVGQRQNKRQNNPTQQAHRGPQKSRSAGCSPKVNQQHQQQQRQQATQQQKQRPSVLAHSACPTTTHHQHVHQFYQHRQHAPAAYAGPLLAAGQQQAHLAHTAYPHYLGAATHHYQQQPVYSPPAAPIVNTSERDCLRLRGLPFEAHVEHVLNFLGQHSEHILFHGVHMVYSGQGQPTGEAVIQMSSAQAAQAAAHASHKRIMQVGKKQRYIEVMLQSLDELRPSLGYGLAAALAARASYAPYAGCETAPTYSSMAPSPELATRSAASSSAGSEQSSSESSSSSSEAAGVGVDQAGAQSQDAAQVAAAHAAAAAYYYHPAFIYYHQAPASVQQQQQQQQLCMPTHADRQIYH